MDGSDAPRVSAAAGQAGLRGSEVALAERYDVALLDLDGVVYVGGDAVPGATQALEKARGAGMRLAFVTNNAARTPETVAAHLRDLGVAAQPAEVVTSAQAAARVLAERLPPNSPVLVVGAEGLRRAVTERGLRVVDTAGAGPVAVVQGHSADTGWRELAEATVAVRGGALWVASNLDPTLPSPRGRLPGNGSMVGVVRTATGVEPVVAGKPEPALHQETVDRTGARRPLVVGDGLVTDIEGAARVGCDSLLVLTGVTGPADLLAAGAHRRPSYVSADLEGLLVPHPAPRQQAGGVWTCGGWSVSATAPRGGTQAATGAIGLAGDGEDVDALRALCALVWHRQPGSGRQVRVEASGAAARATVERLGL